MIVYTVPDIISRLFLIILRMEKEVAIPYYLQVAETIRSRILGGHYVRGDLIPSYQGLEREFKVSNITVRKAIEILVRDGIITRKRGVGTVVSKSDPEVITFEVNGNFERLRHSAEQIPLDIDLLEITTGPCPGHVQRALSVEPEKKTLADEEGAEAQGHRHVLLYPLQ